MEDKKEDLNKEQLQEYKKKVIKTILIVLKVQILVGLLVGVALIVTGVVKAKKYESLIPETGIINEVNTNDETVSARYYIFGAFFIISSVMLAGGIYSFTKQIPMTAFTTQQVMPLAQEGLEKMAPSIGNVGEENKE